MSDIATNRDASYLKAHADAEKDGAIKPTAFEQYWLAFLTHLKKRGGSISNSELEHEKFTARTWFEFGAMSERLR